MKAKNLSLLVILFSLILVFPSCRDKSLVTKNIDASEIKGIIVDGPWDVTVSQSDLDNGVTLEYSAFLEDKITAQVKSDGYLYLKLKSTINMRGFDLKADLKAATIEKVKIEGASFIKFYDSYVCEKLDISISGASKIKSLICTGTNTDVNLSGASSIEGFSFNGTSVYMDLSGASSIKNSNIHVDMVNLVSSGASCCDVSGSSSDFTAKGSGASSFDLLNIEVDVMDITLSGASNANVYVVESIRGGLSGASSLKYRIGANVSNLKCESASSIRQIN